MQDQQQLQYNDEIDLKDLVLGLWQGKWIIIACVVFALVAAMAYLKLVPQTYNGTVVVKNIDLIQAESYQALSDTEFLVLDAEYLAKLFFERLDTRESLVNAVIQQDLVSRIEDESDTAYFLRVNKAVQSIYSFVEPAHLEAKNGVQFWKINVQTSNPDLSLDILKQVMDIEQKLLRETLISKFERSISFYEADINNRLKAIAIEKQGMIKAYKIQLAIRVANLKEQAAIARSLELPKGKHLTQGVNLQLVQNQGEALDVFDMNATSSHYTQGYIALEQEAAHLQNRGNPELYMPELAKLVVEEYALENDSKVIEAQALFARTPLANGDFEAVIYNLDGVEMTSTLKTMLVLAIFIVLGGMLGVFVLIIRNVLNK